MSSESKSRPAYRLENQVKTNVKGVHTLIKKSIIDGETKGLSFSLLTKKDDKFHRISVIEKEKDTFEFTEKIDDKETKKEINMSDVKKMVNKNKDLDFVRDYIENKRSMYKGKGGAVKKSSKKGSKKASKKVVAKKASKKASKKSSKKVVAKKSSKKAGSKKASKKVVAKKSSKKASKKAGSKKA